MRTRSIKLVSIVAVVALVFTVPMLTGLAGAKGRSSFKIVKVGPKDGGGEPSIATDLTPTSRGYGNLYVSWPGDHVNMAVSKNNGGKWMAAAEPPNVDSVGDTSVNVDASGAVYQTNLNNLELSDKTLQAEIWKSIDYGRTWPQQGEGFANSDNASNQPMFVDRQWAGAWIPPGKTTDQADVYLSYHDFGPSQIWVNVSTDGGKTFGPPIDVIAASAPAQAATFCNSIPGGLQVAQSGQHAGRVYVGWITADVATNVATGCNITQMDTFHSVWIAWSDDQGGTWTAEQVFDGGFGHDASALFADLTLDNQGEPYMAFGDNLKDEWDTYVIGSHVADAKDASPEWQSAPVQVNSDTGTHYFPAIAVGDPCRVDVAYLRTPTVIPVLPYGKPSPESNDTDKWYLYAAQTQNLFASSPTWTVDQITPGPMHVGDICVLGIFCLASGGNRDLLDFIDVSIDKAGFAHIAYTDDFSKNTEGIYAANQVSGGRVT